MNNRGCQSIERREINWFTEESREDVRKREQMAPERDEGDSWSPKSLWFLMTAGNSLLFHNSGCLKEITVPCNETNLIRSLDYKIEHWTREKQITVTLIKIFALMLAGSSHLHPNYLFQGIVLMPEAATG